MELNKIQFITGTVVFLVCLIIGIRLYLKKLNNSFYYLLGLSFAVSGLIVNSLLKSNILSHNIFTEHALIFGNAIEMSLFSLALGNRINTLRKSNTLISIEKDDLDKLNKDLLTQQQEIHSKNMELAVMNEELKTNTKILEEANQTKSKLFSILGHDLRSPIGSLEGLLNLVNIGLVSQEEFQAFMPQLHKNVKNMQSTLENLLQWSISQMEGIHATPERVSVQKIADEQVHLFAEVGRAKNIQVQAEVSEKFTVWADENHLRLVLRNLINNALKFTPEGESVKILAESVQNTVVISVQDNGVGMTAEQVGKLFKKNQNFTTYGTGGEKGTGLGLQLCQEIVTKNGGEIWAISEQGKGSTFSFSLPAQA